jgi:hypothetical protein
MSRFISIRGWLETQFELVPQFEAVANDFAKKYNEYMLDEKQAILYQKGWQFPDQAINWTSYIFYGADVKEIGEQYIKDQIVGMLKLFDGTRGLFYFDDDEGDFSAIWKIFDSKITEENREI